MTQEEFRALDAAEFVRRAERGLGVAIREGQARGEIQTRGDNRHTIRSDDSNSYKASPGEFAERGELSGNGDNNIYTMTDNVTDAQFEEALAEARDENNLSRANVAGPDREAGA